jgi:ribosomal protein L37E
MKRINCRKLASEHYNDRLFCAHCGFGIPEVHRGYDPDARPAKKGLLGQAHEGRGPEGGSEPEAEPNSATTQVAFGGTEGRRDSGK